MSQLVEPRDADERNVHIAWISGTMLPSFRIVSKRRGRWRLEYGRWGNGRRVFPAWWIGALWTVPDPKGTPGWDRWMAREGRTDNDPSFQ